MTWILITELIRPKTPASVGGGFQRAVKSSMDSANIQRGLNPPLNEVSFKSRTMLCGLRPAVRGSFLWIYRKWGMPAIQESGVTYSGVRSQKSEVRMRKPRFC